MRLGSDLLSFPQLAASVKKVAARVSPSDAMNNLKALEETQRLLSYHTKESNDQHTTMVKMAQTNKEKAAAVVKAFHKGARLWNSFGVLLILHPAAQCALAPLATLGFAVRLRWSRRRATKLG